MRIPGMNLEVKAIHEALRTEHNWFHIHVSDLIKFEPALSKSRRVCLLCGRVEFIWDETGYAGEEWQEETSGLATQAILKVLLDKKGGSSWNLI